MKINKPEIFFVAIILIFGIFLVFSTPIGAGPDEETHLGRIWEMSKGVLIPNQYMSTGPYYPFVFYQLSYRQNVNLIPISWETWKAQLFTKIDWSNLTNYTIRARYFPTLYLPQAFIMGIMGRVFDVPVGFIIYVERLSYLFIYALLIYFAIRLAPAGKWVLGILAVSPMSLITASSIMPDSQNNGIAFLFIAWVLYLNSPAKRVYFSRRDWFISALLVLAICTLKLNTIPLLFILLLIPRIKFGPVKWLVLFVIFTLISILVVGIGWNFFTSSQLLFTATEETYNSLDQLKGILADPGHFLSAVAYAIQTHFPNYLHDWVGISGYDYWDLPAPVYWITPLLLLCAALGESAGDLLDKRKRILMLATFLAVFFGTITLFYLIYNPPGSLLIPGIQGRYFIFAGPLVLIALLPKKAILQPHKIWLQAGSILIAGLSVGALFLAYHLTCGNTYYSTGLCYLPRYKNWSPETSLPLKISQANSANQTFSAACNNLTQIRLWVRNKGTSPDPLLVKIQDTGSQADILSRSISAAEIPPGGWLEIQFGPVPDSENKKYALEVSSGGSASQSPIELGYSSRNEYIAGDLTIQKENQDGDLLFQYGCSVGLENLINPPKP